MTCQLLENVVDRIFQNNLSCFFDDEFWGSNGAVSRNQFPVNLRETDKTYEMEVIAPSLRKEDFRLEVVDDMLTITSSQRKKRKRKMEMKGG